MRHRLESTVHDNPISHDPDTDQTYLTDLDKDGPSGDTSTSSVKLYEDMPEVAWAYYKLGYTPIPNHKVKRKPLVRFGMYKDKRPSWSVVQGWFTKFPESRIGLLTGGAHGLVVIDIDPRNGGDQSFQKLIAEVGAHIFDQATVSTPRDGQHFYFGAPSTLMAGSRTDIRPGIDVKARAGQVLAPPSRGTNGKSYSWVDELIAQRDLPVIPETLVNLIMMEKVSTGHKKENESVVATPHVSKKQAVDARTRALFKEVWSYTGTMLREGEQSYLCVLPSHDDHHPSLSVDSRTCNWYCHRCEIGGGPTQLLQQLGHLIPRDECRKLSEELSQAQGGNTVSRQVATSASPSSPSYCPQSRARLYENDAGAKVMRPPCEQWSCSFCGPRKRGRLVTHYFDAFKGLGETVYEMRMPLCGRKAFCKYVQRYVGEYPSVPVSHEVSAVFTTVQKDNALPVPLAHLSGRIEEAILSMPLHEGRNGVNISASKLLRQPRKNNSGSKVRSVKSVQRVRDVAARDGRLLASVGHGEGGFAEVDLPEAGTEEFTMFAMDAGIGMLTAQQEREWREKARRRAEVLMHSTTDDGTPAATDASPRGRLG